MLDEVAWLLNLRGRDVPHCPVLQGFVLVHAPAKGGKDGKDSMAGDGADAGSSPGASCPPSSPSPAATLFVDETKISANLAAELAADGVAAVSYGQIQQAIEQVVAAGEKVMLDPNKVHSRGPRPQNRLGTCELK
jgi:Xaa-Pro aminopeptidase